MTSSLETNCWSDLDLALASGVDRILLYGQPGTGKTYYALTRQLDHNGRTRPAYRVLCSPDMTTAEVDGLWRPAKDEWKFVEGSALRAWKEGGRLILDELDQASGDVLTALLLICDSDGSAVREHPETGERLSPADGFQIIATTNAERLTDLPANLLDRFPVRININTVNPAALLALPVNLRHIAKAYAERPRNRYSLRSFFTYDKLSTSDGVSRSTALRLVFGESEATRIQDALAIAEASHDRAPREGHADIASTEAASSIRVDSSDDGEDDCDCEMCR